MDRDRMLRDHVLYLLRSGGAHLSFDKALAGLPTDAGSYTITPVVTGLSATNYVFTPANGTLIITRAPSTTAAWKAMSSRLKALS